jgi:hypothetical protein
LAAAALLAASGVGPVAGWAADPSPCLGCHDAADLATNDVTTIKDALHDPGIPPHKPFTDTTDEEAAGILEALKAL